MWVCECDEDDGVDDDVVGDDDDECVSVCGWGSVSVCVISERVSNDDDDECVT